MRDRDGLQRCVQCGWQQDKKEEKKEEEEEEELDDEDDKEAFRLFHSFQNNNNNRKVPIKEILSVPIFRSKGDMESMLRKV